jgi:hypothetical protein
MNVSIKLVTQGTPRSSLRPFTIFTFPHNDDHSEKYIALPRISGANHYPQIDLFGREISFCQGDKICFPIGTLEFSQ